jgi:DNA-binding protein Fis
MIYTITFSATKPAGAILFGTAFWALARKLVDRTLKNYMLTCAFGMIILFAANQPIGLLLTSYPPFGLATISFMGVSSYLVLLGIYSSAISVSEDSKLRQSIRNFARKESRLLDSFGTAHMEQEIEKRVMALTKQNQERMAEETGIQSSLSEDEIKQYVEQVIKEVKKPKMSNDDNTA